MLSTVPDRSTEQRMTALVRANEVRMYRAEMKRRLAAGEVLLEELLDGDDPLLATMKIGAVLMALPAVGATKARDALVRARISPSKTLGGMTGRQRRDLYREMTRTPAVARAVRGDYRMGS